MYSAKTVWSLAQTRSRFIRSSLRSRHLAGNEKHDAKFGYDHVMYAIYKGRKFHAYYAMQGGKLVKQGTLRLTEYTAIKAELGALPLCLCLMPTH